MSINKKNELLIKNKYLINERNISLVLIEVFSWSTSYALSGPLAFAFDELSKVLYIVNQGLDIVKYQYTNKTLNVK